MMRRVCMCVMLLLAACKAEPPRFQTTTPDGGPSAPGPSAGAAPAAPMVTAPELTSLPTVALRGSSPGAAQLVVQTGQAKSVVGLTLPDGSFCIDVPLQPGQANPLQVFALGEGKASSATELTVVQVPTAPAPSNGTCAAPTRAAAPSCSGANAACDPRCNGCAEDALQPNFLPSDAPAIALNSTYASLSLCPCRPDWFTFVLFQGQHITLQASYQKTAEFDLDLALFHGKDVLPQLSGTAPLVTGTAGTSSDSATRTLDFTATAGGAYYLRIAASSDGARGSYSLVTQSKRTGG